MIKFGNYLIAIGRNLRSARKKLGLRQVDVEACGISYRHYQNIEAGKVNVSIETLYKLSRLFKVRVTDLVQDD